MWTISFTLILPVTCRLLSTTPSQVHKPSPAVPPSSLIHPACSINPRYRPNQLLGPLLSSRCHRHNSNSWHSHSVTSLRTLFTPFPTISTTPLTTWPPNFGVIPLRRHPSPTSSNHQIPYRILRAEVDGLGPLSECARLRVPAAPAAVPPNNSAQVNEMKITRNFMKSQGYLRIYPLQK